MSDRAAFLFNFYRGQFFIFERAVKTRLTTWPLRHLLLLYHSVYGFCNRNLTLSAIPMINHSYFGASGRPEKFFYADFDLEHLKILC